MKCVVFLMFLMYPNYSKTHTILKYIPQTDCLSKSKIATNVTSLREQNACKIGYTGVVKNVRNLR